jgi:hypothetical protein
MLSNNAMPPSRSGSPTRAAVSRRMQRRRARRG